MGRFFPPRTGAGAGGGGSSYAVPREDSGSGSPFEDDQEDRGVGPSSPSRQAGQHQGRFFRPRVNTAGAPAEGGASAAAADSPDRDLAPSGNPDDDIFDRAKQEIDERWEAAEPLRVGFNRPQPEGAIPLPADSDPFRSAVLTGADEYVSKPYHQYVAPALAAVDLGLGSAVQKIRGQLGSLDESEERHDLPLSTQAGAAFRGIRSVPGIGLVLPGIGALPADIGAGVDVRGQMQEPTTHTGNLVQTGGELAVGMATDPAMGGYASAAARLGRTGLELPALMEAASRGVPGAAEALIQWQRAMRTAQIADVTTGVAALPEMGVGAVQEAGALAEEFAKDPLSPKVSGHALGVLAPLVMGGLVGADVARVSRGGLQKVGEVPQPRAGVVPPLTDEGLLSSLDPTAPEAPPDPLASIPLRDQPIALDDTLDPANDVFARQFAEEEAATRAEFPEPIEARVEAAEAPPRREPPPPIDISAPAQAHDISSAIDEAGRRVFARARDFGNWVRGMQREQPSASDTTLLRTYNQIVAEEAAGAGEGTTVDLSGLEVEPEPPAPGQVPFDPIRPPTTPGVQFMSGDPRVDQARQLYQSGVDNFRDFQLQVRAADPSVSTQEVRDVFNLLEDEASQSGVGRGGYGRGRGIPSIGGREPPAAPGLTRYGSIPMRPNGEPDFAPLFGAYPDMADFRAAVQAAAPGRFQSWEIDEQFNVLQAEQTAATTRAAVLARRGPGAPPPQRSLDPIMPGYASTYDTIYQERAATHQGSSTPVTFSEFLRGIKDIDYHHSVQEARVAFDEISTELGIDPATLPPFDQYQNFYDLSQITDFAPDARRVFDETAVDDTPASRALTHEALRARYPSMSESQAIEMRRTLEDSVRYNSRTPTPGTPVAARVAAERARMDAQQLARQEEQDFLRDFQFKPNLDPNAKKVALRRYQDPNSYLGAKDEPLPMVLEDPGRPLKRPEIEGMISSNFRSNRSPNYQGAYSRADLDAAGFPPDAPLDTPSFIYSHIREANEVFNNPGAYDVTKIPGTNVERAVNSYEDPAAPVNALYRVVDTNGRTMAMVTVHKVSHYQGAAQRDSYKVDTLAGYTPGTAAVGHLFNGIIKSGLDLTSSGTISPDTRRVLASAITRAEVPWTDVVEWAAGGISQSSFTELLSKGRGIENVSDRTALRAKIKAKFAARRAAAAARGAVSGPDAAANLQAPPGGVGQADGGEAGGAVRTDPGAGGGDAAGGDATGRRAEEVGTEAGTELGARVGETTKVSEPRPVGRVPEAGTGAGRRRAPRGGGPVAHDITSATGEAVDQVVEGVGKLAAKVKVALSPLPKGPLKGDRAEVEAAFVSRLEEDLPGMVAQYYTKAEELGFPNEIGSDIAKELSPEYSASKESRLRYTQSLARASSWLASKVYADAIAKPVKPGFIPMVLATAGGTGSGKSSARHIEALKAFFKGADLIFDSTFSDFDSAVSKIEATKASGRKFAGVYVYREPVDSYVNGVLPRAEDTGRTVSLGEGHAKTHTNSPRVFHRLMEKYKDDPMVDLIVVDNSRGLGNQALIDRVPENALQYDPDEIARAVRASPLFKAREAFVDYLDTDEYAQGLEGGGTEAILQEGAEASGQVRPEGVHEAGGRGDGGRAEADQVTSEAGLRPATPDEFIAARSKSTRAAFLSPLSKEALAGKQAFINEEGTVGYLLDAEGDIANLFNNSGVKGAGRKAFVEGIQKGARTLDAFDPFLPEIYSQYGFEVTGRMKFNDDYAPEGWNYERDGRPDVVFMAYKGGDRGSIARRAEAGEFTPYSSQTSSESSRYFTDYDEAKAVSRAAARDGESDLGGARDVEGGSEEVRGGRDREDVGGGVRADRGGEELLGEARGEAPLPSNVLTREQEAGFRRWLGERGLSEDQVESTVRDVTGYAEGQVSGIGRALGLGMFTGIGKKSPAWQSYLYHTKKVAGEAASTKANANDISSAVGEGVEAVGKVVAGAAKKLFGSGSKAKIPPTPPSTPAWLRSAPTARTLAPAPPSKTNPVVAGPKVGGSAVDFDPITGEFAKGKGPKPAPAYSPRGVRSIPKPPDTGRAALSSDPPAPSGRPSGRPGPEADINVSRISVDPKVESFVGRAVAEGSDFYGRGTRGARGPKRTWEEVRRKAVLLGMDTSSIHRAWKAKGGMLSDVEIEAASIVIHETHDRARKHYEDSQKLRTEGRDRDADLQQDLFDSEMSNIQAVTYAMVGAKSEAARALAIGRKIGQGLTPEERNAWKILQKTSKYLLNRSEIPQSPEFREKMYEAIKAQNAKKVTELLSSAYDSTFLSKYVEWWTSGLLSGPPTQVVNFASNAVEALVSRPTERFIEGVLAQGAGKGPKERYMGEALAMYRGAALALPRALYGPDGLVQALADIGSLRYEGKQITKALAGDETALGFLEFGRAIEGKKGEAIRMPLNVLQAADQFWKSIIKGQELHAEAYRSGRRAGLKGQALSTHIHSFLANFSKELQPEVWARVIRAMDDGTYQTQLGNVGRSIQQVATRHPILRLLGATFIRTPTNLLKKMLARTPLGLLKLSNKKLTSEQRRLVKAQALFGSAVIAALYMAMDDEEGLEFSGGGPEDWNRREELRQTGWEPYSVRYNKGPWFAYKRLDPLSSLVGIVADMKELSKLDKLSDKLDKATAALGENAFDKSFWSGLLQTFEAVTQMNRGGPGRWVKQQMGSHIPMTGLVTKIAQAIDPTQRESQAFETVSVGGVPIPEPMAARLPGASTLLPAKRTIAGEAKVRNQNSPFEQILNPFTMSRELQGAIPDLQREMVKVEASVNQPQRYISFRDGKGRQIRLDLDDREYGIVQDQYKEAAQRAVRLTKSSYYHGLPDDIDRKEALQKLFREARSKGRAKLYTDPGFRAREKEARRKSDAPKAPR